jgi:hypothetical protein
MGYYTRTLKKWVHVYCCCFRAAKADSDENYEVSNIFRRGISMPETQENPMHMTEDRLAEYIIG